MKKINPNKVFTEYLSPLTNISPLKGRKYTMTHSDDTGDLFVTIGLTYAEDQINPTRDEVLLELLSKNNKPIFYGKVLVDDENIKDNIRIRNAIFLKEMPTALQAIRYADRALFEKYPLLDQVPIYIQFSSTKPQFNKLRYFGTMKNYRI
ncbi:staygreen family protein [Cellulosilyticum sp. I15G10I2]|uniref:staygreen family protein n=1 Tax=Cellulosilyticum sp. I15G10I2 TaxID=1892843 RepID=UPI00085CD210|nr:staygreen family protein [Cellulosilyticum sp. I15G10I2]